MRFGIDLGTTNSAIAYFDGSKVHIIRSDEKNTGSSLLSSLIYINKDTDIIVGTDAASRYLTNESQRDVRWQPKVVGEVLVSVSNRGTSTTEFWQALTVLVDEAATGRLFQSIKTALRTMYPEEFQVINQNWSIDQLLAIILKNLKQCAEEESQQLCEDVLIGRPVTFSYDPAIDALAEETVYKAAFLAGLKSIRFVLEPVGIVVQHHAKETKRVKGLIFDFGGGHLNLTVAEMGGSKPPKILATQGVLLGGDDLDRKLMQMLFKYFAADEKKNSITLSEDMISQLQNWQTMPELSKPQFQERIHGVIARARQVRDTHAVGQLEALNTLIQGGLGFKLFQILEETKKRLSIYTLAPITLEQGTLKIRETIKRDIFGNRLRKEVVSVKEGIEQVLHQADLETDDINIVVRTGGTSQVLVFIELLESLFGKEKLRTIDPLTSVVSGLAMMAHQSEGEIPDYASKYFHNPDELISDISVSSDSVYEAFIIQAGETAYLDVESTRIDKLSIQLSALPAIRTARADLNNADDNFLSFTIAHPANIYVAYRGGQTGIPNWLRNFSRSSYTVEVKDNLDRITKMPVYVKEFEAGEVVLGGNNASEFEGVYHHYLVIVERRI